MISPTHWIRYPPISAARSFDLGEILPSWTDVDNRGGYLFRASPAWQALGVIGHLQNDVANEDERRPMLNQIVEQRLDWRRSNLQWESVIGTKQQELDEAGMVKRE
jgi:hypothetical protein